ncbi:MAG: alpha/beta fold hydrolase [Lachnospiraceae bacterium]|nr:alpha/beta fold hydrolase [Robinsoniella sp.]MDY3767522.1 alpha/beta fold hydrolase [Lachnospiraceae bacterium]
MKHKLKNSIVLTSLALLTTHLMNKFLSATAVVKNLLKSHMGHRFSWRFGDVFYSKTGSGAPLLLIHDLDPSSSSYEWNEMIQKLSKNYTVYALDLLGCGRSDKPNMTYTNYVYVQLISDFIQKVIGCKTDIAVTGLSSSFIIMACYNNPSLFNKIIIINPESISSLNMIPTKKSKIAKFILELPVVGSTVYHILTSKKKLEYSFTEDYLFNPFHFQVKYLDAYHEAAHLNHTNGRYLLSSKKGLFLNFNIVKALREINNSIFILYGNHIKNAQLNAESYIKINPSIEVAPIKNTKYLPQIEDPDQVLDYMNIFLA